MKKIMFLAAIIFVGTIQAQTVNYEDAMKQGLEKMAKDHSVQEKMETASYFQRIAEKEKDQWLPYYYAALIKANMAKMQIGGDTDALADETDLLLDKASAIEDNSEIYCVRSMVATARMIVDPQNRYMQYMGVAQKAIEKAIEKDPTNPRPFVIQATDLLFTPEQYGGGVTVAKKMAEKAAKMIETFKPASPLHPVWGKEIVDYVLSR